MMRLTRFRSTLALLASAVLGHAAEPADLVVLNGDVLTLDARSRRSTAVAIKDGVFVAVGPDAEVRNRIGPHTRTIDAQGRSVIPGLIESHVHATGAARGEARQPFRQLHSLAEIRDWLREKARTVPAGGWIQLPRVDVTRIRERRMPARADLDAAAPDHPVVFTWQYANRTVQVLNSRAIAAAGITRGTEPPRGGRVHFDADGAPTGLLENSGALLTRFLSAPAVPEEKYRETLVDLLRRYNESGITSITERNSNVDGFRTYEALRREDRLPVRVTVTIGLRTDGSVEGTEKAIRAIPFRTGDGDDWVRVGPLKVGVDGGALYGTAYMREPYGPRAYALYGISDPEYRGDLRISVDKLENIIRTGHRLGWQMSSHVTGDAGVDAVLDALEAAKVDGPVAPRRYNLIHAYFANEETARRAARLGAVVDTQPAWFYKDGDALLDALGQERMAGFIGVQTWRRAGVKVALNADHMQGFDPDTSLNPYNPFLAMQTAVTRKTESGRVIGPRQRVSREEALRMFTIDAAWLNFDEGRKGSIEVGKLADLAILTGNLLHVPEEQMHALRADVTIVGGRVVYDRGRN
jgi:predicted amidohydrolase YtcJ